MHGTAEVEGFRVPADSARVVDKGGLWWAERGRGGGRRGAVVVNGAVDALERGAKGAEPRRVGPTTSENIAVVAVGAVILDVDVWSKLSSWD